MRAIATAVILTATVGSASAQFVPVDFSAQKNFARTTGLLANGVQMPFGSQVFNHGTDSVPVEMDGGISGLGNWGWSGHAAQGGSGTRTLTVATNLSGATSVFTMMNSFWGTPGGPFLSVTFNATNGVSQRFDIFGNVDLRDYNQNALYTNSINGMMTQQVWNNSSGQRLDMQRFDLDAAFANETLTSIVFEDTGDEGLQRAFITGITVQVPAPGSAIALGTLGLMATRRRR